MSVEEGIVIGCHNPDQWKEQLAKHKGSQKLVVVDFTASWCGPCRMIAPILAELAKKTPHVTFLKVDVDEVESVAQEYSVEAMPTFLFIKNGEIVDKVVGSKKDELIATVNKHAGAASVSA
ncbi:hypothetical protein QVD17_10530 [Tagetes erecta]|uniref:Thioredoxin domain-containing protein n=1 Tax=Tagetes erecta TaxID=13708 RepID=A0AAD8L847_TARER|nr:hypothetical protein QVD17_10530 [Tagetes erecta]